MRIAVLQMNSGREREENLRAIESAIESAAGRGAELLATPENATFMGRIAEKPAVAEPIPGPTTERLAARAREAGIAVLVGSLTERAERSDRVHNTSVFIGPDGGILAAYRKIHLFDPVLDVVDELESDGVLAGDRPVTAEAFGQVFGLTVCYDLRFPELYRRLVDLGAGFLCVPSAFTVPTGRAHWHVLLRARAIENGAFVVAPAQWGRHGRKRETYGHSLVVDPWGRVLVDLEAGTGVEVVECEPKAIAEARRKLPALEHRRPDLL